MNVKSKEYYIKYYIKEVIEAFVSIIIIRYAMEKPLHLPTLVQTSLLIGLVTCILEQFNPEFKSSVSQGITFTVGSQLASSV
jgi:hypothetical protein